VTRRRSPRDLWFDLLATVVDPFTVVERGLFSYMSLPALPRPRPSKHREHKSQVKPGKLATERKKKRLELEKIDGEISSVEKQLH